MVDSINGVNVNSVNTDKYKKLTPQEIIKQKNEGENIPAEIVTWAQDVLAYAKIPDNVTYEQVDGDVGIEALNQLGIPSDEQVGNVDNDAGVPNEENPDIPEPPAPKAPEGNNAILTEKGEEEEVEEDFSLSNSDITADNDEIRKRKERKGIIQ